MGMAASQARLLTITARMHDVEYQAQSIQNAKIALATQSDQVYQDYIAALDATTFTVKDFDGNRIVANFNSLCGINAVDVGNFRFTLKNEKGQLIVADDIAEEYQNFIDAGGDNAYEFAMYMLTGGNNFDQDVENLRKAHEEICNDERYSDLKEKRDKTLNELLKMCDCETDEGADGLYKIFGSNNPEIFFDGDGEYEKAKEKWDSYNALNNQLLFNTYWQNSENLFDMAGLSPDYNEQDFQYYVNIYEQIQANHESFIAISEFNGINGIGDAANDSDWLQNMIQSGKITIDSAKLDKFGKVAFTSTGVSNESKLEYVASSTVDKAKLAKAEAEYEHKTKELDRKDKQFDMDLSKLETERTALKTEYDSVKKVIEDNIERTFGIFS
mgnify:CR=1 FL=1